MTAIQLRAELFREMSPLLDSEAAMEKLLKSLMTKEEFFANVDEALEQAQKGQVHRMEPDESLDDFLKRVG